MKGVQTIPDKQLAALGAKRSSCIRVPYFGVALQCLPGTELVLTLTSGMTSVIKNDRRLRLVKAPQELHAFHFLMAWHPQAQLRPASCMASWCDAINCRGSCRVKDLRRTRSPHLKNSESLIDSIVCPPYATSSRQLA